MSTEGRSDVTNLDEEVSLMFFQLVGRESRAIESRVEKFASWATRSGRGIVA